ncbi:MAG: hypothetical protein ACR2PW_02740, partial [Gammaproteobacteria bacterium]
CTFNKTFNISANQRLGCVLDVTGADIKYPFSLERVSCHLRRKRHIWLFRWLPGLSPAADAEDIKRLRCLKKLAQADKDHTRALEYRVQELQASRWHNLAGNSGDWALKFIRAVPECLFWLFSNYGRSMLLPAFWLLVLVLGMASVYDSLSPKPNTDSANSNAKSSIWPTERDYSLGQTFIWVPAAQRQRQATYQAVHCGTSAQQIDTSTDCKPDSVISFLSMVHSLIAVLLLFLFGLGARNRFLM